MRVSKILVGLAWLIVLLALVAAATGLIYQGEGNSFSFTTVRGDTAEIYGQGLYRYDTTLIAVGYRVIDAVTLLFCIPLLVVSILLYRGGSLKGGLLLTGTLAYFLYNYGSMALGAAYNNLFFVYVALFSASLFAFVLALSAFKVGALPSHFSRNFPRRAMGVFLIVCGGVLMFVWIALSILPALFEGRAPAEVASYTTFMTGVLDIAIVAPALIVSGALLLRREATGYLLAPTMLVFTAIVGISLLAAGIVQRLNGLTSVGQFVGFTVSFAVLTLIDVWLTIALFRNISNTEGKRESSTTLRAAHA